MRVLGRWIGVIFGVCVTLYLVVAIYSDTVVPLLWKIKTRRECMALLRSTSDLQKLEKSLGNKGWVVRLKDGAWVAHCYRDNHVGKITTVSLMMDNAGNLYESELHSCGPMALRVIWMKWCQQHYLYPSDPKMDPRIYGVLIKKKDEELDDAFLDMNLEDFLKSAAAFRFERTYE